MAYVLYFPDDFFKPKYQSLIEHPIIDQKLSNFYFHGRNFKMSQFQLPAHVDHAPDGVGEPYLNYFLKRLWYECCCYVTWKPRDGMDASIEVLKRDSFDTWSRGRLLRTFARQEGGESTKVWPPYICVVQKWGHRGGKNSRKIANVLYERCLSVDMCSNRVPEQDYKKQTSTPHSSGSVFELTVQFLETLRNSPCMYVKGSLTLVKKEK